MKSLSQSEPGFDRFFARIHPVVAATFTEAQVAALRQAHSSFQGKSHAIDIRFSMPLPLCRFYLVFLAGLDRRSTPRFVAQKHYSLWTIAHTALLTGIFILTLVGLFEILQGMSWLHLSPSSTSNPAESAEPFSPASPNE